MTKRFELYDWQDADVTAAVEHPDKSAFFAWEMGLGKTLAAVEYARRIKAEQVIVVLPLNTRKSWEKTVAAQIPGMPFYRLTNNKGEVASFMRLRSGERGFYVIGWELMRSGVLTGQNADLIIADETHKMANYGRSLQSDRMREFHSEYKLALSGTPAANKPDGIFSTLNWLWPERYRSYHRWIEDFWRTRRNGAVIDLVRELVPGGVVADIPMFSRRLRADHRDDMPDRLPEIPVEIELTAAQRKLYDQFTRDSLAWVDDDDTGDTNFIPTSNPLVKQLRQIQVCLAVPTVIEGEVTFKENAKSAGIDALLEVLEQIGDETLVVYTPSAKLVPVVVAQLTKKGIKAEAFFGETKPAKRDELIETLGTEYRVLVAGIAAIAEGTDGLQHKCHNEFWLGKHPNALLNTQCKMRLDRPGQTEPINSWYVYAVDTVMVDQLERLDEIEANLAEMLDNH